MKAHLQKMNDVRALLIATVLASAIGVALFGIKLSADPPDNDVTTQTAAAAAGARVAPTDPKLQIEPK